MLYCECFRSGSICEGCNCLNCLNTWEHGKDRQEAIRKCLEINPQAFAVKSAEKPKKGCKCKKSGCRKGYCECYQQGKGCSEFCICEGCQNQVEPERNHERMGGVMKKLKTECLSVWFIMVLLNNLVHDNPIIPLSNITTSSCRE